MKAKGKKLVSLLLAFSLLTIPGDLFAKKRKHGVEIEIWGKGGRFMKGELIAVKKNSLLLLEE